MLAAWPLPSPSMPLYSTCMLQKVNFALPVPSPMQAGAQITRLPTTYTTALDMAWHLRDECRQNWTAQEGTRARNTARKTSAREENRAVRRPMSSLVGACTGVYPSPSWAHRCRRLAIYLHLFSSRWLPASAGNNLALSQRSLPSRTHAASLARSMCACLIFRACPLPLASWAWRWRARRRAPRFACCRHAAGCTAAITLQLLNCCCLPHIPLWLRFWPDATATPRRTDDKPRLPTQTLAPSTHPSLG